MSYKNQATQKLVQAFSLHQAGKLGDAASLYQAVLASDPKNADALRLLGTIHFQLGNHVQAIPLLERSLKANPRQPDALNNLGTAFHGLQRYDEALASFNKAIALKPDNDEAYYNRGITFRESRKYEAALANFDRALAFNPQHVDAYINRGNILQQMKHNEEALASYDKAIALKPDYGEAWYNRGVTLQEMKRYDEALVDLDRAMSLKPDAAHVTGSLLHTKMHLCHWQGIDALIQALAGQIKAGTFAPSPFILLATPLSPALQKTCAENFIKNRFPLNAVPLWDGKQYSHDRIRIGYFSADFHSHATSYLIAKLFELHDRAKFEVTAFSFGPPSSDAMRKRLENAFEHFIDVSAKSDLDIATLARKREIDIAIDLKGLTGDAKPGIFALRPAPVQVSYLGYPGTMGTNHIDYIIADDTVIPQSHERYYTEKIVTLPHSYQVNDSSRSVFEKHYSRGEMGLPEDRFVFCCFNNGFKITPDVFDIWMQLLHKVEGSVLWLLEGNPTSASNLRAEAKSRGIDGGRLVFARYTDPDSHMARQQLGDLFLDTFYCNAHTTASDALWAGLPVLTCAGETFAARVAASLLYAAELPELVTHSHAEYEALALALATDSQKLSGIRKKLAQNRATCPLFNTALTKEHLEQAYIKMIERLQKNERPSNIRVGT